ncbi:hypothetical protein AWZ03_003310 [Drosophila navojoa]|uniref:Uncharacterized protein n=1 Tax=Drosophila navojoa TaxID=7232 RepID=A0A484BRC8_DRONA|nr:hypothetical protein AWZ03_003310 [Drosophila navojoa]
MEMEMGTGQPAAVAAVSDLNSNSDSNSNANSHSNEPGRSWCKMPSGNDHEACPTPGPGRAVTEPRIMDAQQCHFWQIGLQATASDKTTSNHGPPRLWLRSSC